MSITLNSLNVPALISSFPSFCNCSGHNLHVNRLRLEQVIFSQHLPQAAPSAMIMRHLLESNGKDVKRHERHTEH